MELLCYLMQLITAVETVTVSEKLQREQGCSGAGMRFRQIF